MVKYFVPSNLITCLFFEHLVSIPWIKEEFFYNDSLAAAPPAYGLEEPWDSLLPSTAFPSTIHFELDSNMLTVGQGFVKDPNSNRAVSVSVFHQLHCLVEEHYHLIIHTFSLTASLVFNSSFVLCGV